jgi:phytoene/squalene synthetase
MVNNQVTAIEKATQELAGLVAQGDAAQALVDAAEKNLADARAALPALEATAKTADTNAAAATYAVVKAEENLRPCSVGGRRPSACIERFLCLDFLL